MEHEHVTIISDEGELANNDIEYVAVEGSSNGSNEVTAVVDMDQGNDNFVLVLDNSMDTPSKVITGYRIRVNNDELRNKISAYECQNVQLLTENNFLNTSITELRASLTALDVEIRTREGVIADFRKQIEELNAEFLLKIDETSDLLVRLELSEFDRVKAEEKVKELQQEVMQNEILLGNEQNLVSFLSFFKKLQYFT